MSNQKKALRTKAESYYQEGMIEWEQWEKLGKYMGQFCKEYRKAARCFKAAYETERASNELS